MEAIPEDVPRDYTDLKEAEKDEGEDKPTTKIDQSSSSSEETTASEGSSGEDNDSFVEEGVISQAETGAESSSEEGDVEEGDAEGGDDDEGDDDDDDEDDEDEVADPLDKLRADCATLPSVKPSLHHYQECVERVTKAQEEPDYAEKEYKEDCVEEYFHLQHHINDCVQPRLFARLKWLVILPEMHINAQKVSLHLV